MTILGPIYSLSLVAQSKKLCAGFSSKNILSFFYLTCFEVSKLFSTMNLCKRTFFNSLESPNKKITIFTYFKKLTKENS